AGERSRDVRPDPARREAALVGEIAAQVEDPARIVQPGRLVAKGAADDAKDIAGDRARIADRGAAGVVDAIDVDRASRQPAECGDRAGGGNGQRVAGSEVEKD